MPAQRARGDLRTYLANLRRPLPLGEKLRQMAANLGRRFRERQMCCGHPGAPGC